MKRFNLQILALVSLVGVQVVTAFSVPGVSLQVFMWMTFFFIVNRVFIMDRQSRCLPQNWIRLKHKSPFPTTFCHFVCQRIIQRNRPMRTLGLFYPVKPINKRLIR
jgi:hypothetical protein